MKNVLVTGGAGYIGSHTCKTLAKFGYRPITYDNLDFGHEWAVKWGPLEIGDISDRKRLDEVFSRYRPVAVIHFAAYAYVGESILDPGKYYRNNVAGSLNLLEICRDHEVDKFVFSSTCATYGNPDEIPIKEEHQQIPINPYGASKLMVERILEDFDKAYGVRSLSLRYFNAAGADPDGELGEEHEPETHLIPLILLSTLSAENAITLFGNDYPTKDGTCIRDYIHVSDLAVAHVRALERLDAGCTTTAMNLGTGRGYSVNEVVAAVEKVTRRKAHVEIGNRRPGDAPVLVADADRARELLRWRPEHSELDEIIYHAWQWMAQKYTALALDR